MTEGPRDLPEFWDDEALQRLLDEMSRMPVTEEEAPRALLPRPNVGPHIGARALEPLGGPIPYPRPALDDYPV